jgi:hypothetical protein
MKEMGGRREQRWKLCAHTLADLRALEEVRQLHRWQLHF